MTNKPKSKVFSRSRRRFLQGMSVGAATSWLTPSAAGAQIQIDKELPGRVIVPIRLKINGSVYRLHVEPRFTLLDVLRNQLDLTGTKRACDRAECGACTVHLDGKPVLACTLLAVSVQGQGIQTIEGLTADGRLHAIQEAFMGNDAFQCGFCTSGMVLAAKGLLDRNPSPTLEQIKEGLSGNLCKCGTYTKIFRAVQDAARALRGGARS